MSHKAEYVRFQDIKEAVSLADVLAHYELRSTLHEKPNGGLRGPCPFRDAGGRGRPFHVTPSGKGWHCFCCDQGGDVLEFVSTREGVPLREAATLMARWFDVVVSPEPAQSPSLVAETPSEALTNKPLGFALKNLDPEHSFFAEQHLAVETVFHFASGFCSRGLMKDRVAIPIHNAAGELVAYAGLSPTDGSIKYPDGFRPELELYNVHRVPPAARTGEKCLIVVPDFLSVWHLYQRGLPNAVALIGSNAEPRLAIWNAK